MGHIRSWRSPTLRFILDFGFIREISVMDLCLFQGEFDDHRPMLPFFLIFQCHIQYLLPSAYPHFF